MAVITYADPALCDFEYIFDFVATDDSVRAAAEVTMVADAISLLERHPLIRRPVEHGLQELLISRGRSGYAALYRYIETANMVMVLAVRHQREAGYQHPAEL